jgi:acyl CoA:acetate/3-ketoacid CoA transferase alpha subunit
LPHAFPNGAKLAIGVDNIGVAMETTRAMIRRGVRDLHLVCVPIAGLQADLLIGAGCVATLETSAITFGEYGVPYRFHDALKRGSLRMMDATCPAIYAALEAGRKDIPFIPLRGLLGSDLVVHRPDWKTIDNPFAKGDPILLLPAIRPDVALIHAPLCRPRRQYLHRPPPRLRLDGAGREERRAGHRRGSARRRSDGVGGDRGRRVARDLRRGRGDGAARRLAAGPGRLL